MNTLNDLRSTLDAHAADIHDDATRSRVVAVHGRAHAARRRRAVGVAAAAVAVVAVTAVPRMLGDAEPAPVDRELIGKVAPATLTSLGYTYDFDRGSENADGAASVELAPSDEPRLLTWAADNTSVRVIDPYAEVRISDGTAFDDWLLVEPGQSGTWAVQAEGAALAVYTLSDERPAGHTVGGTTFREQVGGDLLLAAAIGDVGEAEVGIEITVPEGGTVRWSTLCQDGPRGAWTHVDFGARGEYVTGPGCDDPNFDPGAHGSTSSLGRPGDTLEATVYLTDGEDGPRVVDDGMRLGLAAYDVAEPTRRVAGYDVPEFLEEDGHLWRYHGDSAVGAGTPRLGFENFTEEALLVQAIVDGSGDQRVTTRWDGGGDGSQSTTGGGVTTFPLLPDSRASIAVRPPVPDGVLLGFAYFNRFD